ncbi:ASCH domain-containing protein [Paenibacillus ginsengarvi]|uniref:ASCH domain-containing protein n=1 Tax=Paenibacillus ginsengarvi TaxID=400777 RepID=A0A3B0BTS4_9BACL|nr:ASCH domain-containing protein [Paenibacillus ginsengarvi]RKN75026.1 ASCH domain-containing protein [Paenibacillus ginsengarvi]
MKAITIIQPWATLIAIGDKQFETRSWPTKYRGPIAIHAGKKVDREACEREPIRSTLAAHGYTAGNLPTGVVVATANLSECFMIKHDTLGGLVLLEAERRRTHFETTDKEFIFGDYTSGRFVWELNDVKQLPDPIPAKGQQGLWNWVREEQTK